jgi:ABC-type transport system involved in multi-copper enzyme maturation permease subunit
MFVTIVLKELRGILVSPKFVGSFGICSFLLLLSVYIGIREYAVSVRQYETARQLNEQVMRAAPSWAGLRTRAYRRPDPMQILVAGVSNDIGRFSEIGEGEGVKLRSSPYAEEPVFAVFRFVDFVSIVQTVLSLFAVVFTFDAINGEREDGTLQLTFSNPIPRATYIVGKFAGSWLGLVFPLLIPVTLCALLIVLYQVPFSAEHWLRFGTILGISLLFFTFFVGLGVFTSAVTRRSSVSFLFSLTLWVTLVLIVPRLGVLTAGQLMPVPSTGEIEGQRDAYAKDRWSQHLDRLADRMRTRLAGAQGLTGDAREAYETEHSAEWAAEDDSLRKAVQADIDQFGVRLYENLRNRTTEQEHLGLRLSRISPSSAYQLAVMNLASTDIGLKSRYEDRMSEYRTEFNQYVDKKQKETGGTGGFRITVDTQRGIRFAAPREKGTLDLSSLPAFNPAAAGFAEGAGSVVVDCGILGLCTLVVLSGTIIAFLRYDIR